MIACCENLSGMFSVSYLMGRLFQYPCEGTLNRRFINYGRRRKKSERHDYATLSVSNTTAAPDLLHLSLQGYYARAMQFKPNMYF